MRSAWRASPLVKAARAGVAEVARTKQPPQAFGHGVEQLGQIVAREFAGNDRFGFQTEPLF